MAQRITHPVLGAGRNQAKGKIVSAEAAVRLIEGGLELTEVAPGIDLEGEYLDMVRDVVDKYYVNVTRYTTSAFLRMKLGDALTRRGVAPHIYDTADLAASHLDDE